MLTKCSLQKAVEEFHVQISMCSYMCCAIMFFVVVGIKLMVPFARYNTIISCFGLNH